MLCKSFIISNEPTVHTHTHTHTHTLAKKTEKKQMKGRKREILHLNQTFAGPS